MTLACLYCADIKASCRVSVSFRVCWGSVLTASPRSCCWMCAGSSLSPSPTSRPRPSAQSSWPSPSPSRSPSSARPELRRYIRHSVWRLNPPPDTLILSVREMSVGTTEALSFLKNKLCLQCGTYNKSRGWGSGATIFIVKVPLQYIIFVFLWCYKQCPKYLDFLPLP